MLEVRTGTRGLFSLGAVRFPLLQKQCDHHGRREEVRRSKQLLQTANGGVQKDLGDSWKGSPAQGARRANGGAENVASKVRCFVFRSRGYARWEQTVHVRIPVSRIPLMLLSSYVEFQRNLSYLAATVVNMYIACLLIGIYL